MVKYVSKKIHILLYSAMFPGCETFLKELIDTNRRAKKFNI
jgi:hypothetical protein